MQLKSHHVALLSPFERKVYSPLIGKIDYIQEKKQKYICESHRYVEGDEDVLPFPERSKRGIMLFTLSQQLAATSTQSVAILEPVVPKNTLHIKRKLLALGAEKVYAVPPSHFLAALYGNGNSPFKYFRQKPDFTLKKLDSDPSNESNIICATNPPPSVVETSSEYNILGILLRRSQEENIELTKLPLFREAAHLGLSQVSELNPDRFWLTSEEEQ